MAERYFLGSGSRIIPPGWRRGPSGVCRYYRAGTYSSLYNSQSILYSTNQLPISLFAVSLSLSLSRSSTSLLHPFFLPLSILSSIPSSEEESKGTKPRHRFPLVLSSNTGGKYERATVSTISHRSLCSSASAIFLVYRVCLLPPADKKRKSRPRVVPERSDSGCDLKLPTSILPSSPKISFPRVFRKREHILEGNVTFTLEASEKVNIRFVKFLKLSRIVIPRARMFVFSTWLLHEEIDYTARCVRAPVTRHTLYNSL